MNTHTAFDWTLDLSTLEETGPVCKEIGEPPTALIGARAVTDHLSPKVIETKWDDPCALQHTENLHLASDSHGRWPSWNIGSFVPKTSPVYNQEDINDQLEMMPTDDEIFAVTSELEKDDLLEFATSIMSIAVNSARLGNLDLDTIRSINGWFASIEATVAAGSKLESILARRRKPRQPVDR